MSYKLISLLPLQIARLLCLVRVIEPVILQDAERLRWVLLVNGRGFTRILQDDPLVAPNLVRPAGAYLPRPREFHSRSSAVLTAQDLGLVPRQTRWKIGAASGFRSRT